MLAQVARGLRHRDIAQQLHISSLPAPLVPAYLGVWTLLSRPAS
ncbi:hypothetical protein [Streptomyces sp. CL12-4]|nr:hypothetical protein [Streptomyces sp. CL12-4]